MNDRILLISPAFFGYEISIQKALEKAFKASVDYLDERPKNSPMVRAMVRIAPKIYSRKITSYYRKAEVLLLNNKYNRILIIKGEVVPAWFLQALRSKNPQAVFSFYTFDSIANSSNFRNNVQFFDVLHSFDRSDCHHYPTLKYKPLFFCEEFDKSFEDVKTKSASFIGTMHSDRYLIVKKLSASLDTSKVFLYFYCQAKWFFWLQKLSGQIPGVPESDISFEKLNRDEVADVFAKSVAVFDVQRTNQSGLTMRTFEALAAGAALITTNQAIAEEEFYDPSYVLIVNENSKPKQIKEFVRSVPHRSEWKNKLQKHSLSNWVLDLFDKPK